MIYFGIALFCTGIFIVQFILSFILGEIDLDSDIDLDADGDVDFSLSDILSFKGLIHFGIGFGWYVDQQQKAGDRTHPSYTYRGPGTGSKDCVGFRSPYLWHRSYCRNS